ncbi:hypothetical protein LAG90_04540 [Marinilongibacter aquaticus]|uniref:hypothetical protein n=1 Tax=Marinilongibacter aquaticus TaxID=2975157 RepID=UPI0021BD16EE|nr:hypothetical protein [Marinilongibacter aquaticus]UBM59915.1 hypothetical protein LAG90_04540 [Marinilongibacter aquaticus]
MYFKNLTLRLLWIGLLIFVLSSESPAQTRRMFSSGACQSDMLFAFRPEQGSEHLLKQLIESKKALEKHYNFPLYKHHLSLLLKLGQWHLQNGKFTEALDMFNTGLRSVRKNYGMQRSDSDYAMNDCFFKKFEMHKAWALAFAEKRAKAKKILKKYMAEGSERELIRQYHFYVRQVPIFQSRVHAVAGVLAY